MRQGGGSPRARDFTRRCLYPARLAPVLALAGALLMAVAASPAAADPGLQAATERLRDSIAEWRREDTAYRAVRAAGKISPRESSEYAQFVAALRVRVIEQCESVRTLGGEEAVRDLDCARGENTRGRAAVVVPPAAVLTEEEKAAAIRARLNAVEGEIDEALLRRQREARATGRGGVAGAAGASGREGTSGGAGSAGGSWGPPAESRPAESQPVSSQESSGEARDQTGNAAARGSDPGGSPRQAARDGGSDDDVVARQLREAAEKETDPVLKEKLWAEYRRYREAKR